MSNIFGQNEEADDDEMDSRTATFPLLNQLFGGNNSNPPAKKPESAQEEGEPEEKQPKKPLKTSKHQPKYMRG
jgi:hypothetical protein